MNYRFYIIIINNSFKYRLAQDFQANIGLDYLH